MKILVIDGNADDRFLLNRWLQDGRHMVDEASNRDEAIGHLHRSAYDVVMIDHKTPALDAGAMLDEVRSAQPSADVILYTGDDDPNLLHALLARRDSVSVMKKTGSKREFLQGMEGVLST